MKGQEVSEYKYYLTVDAGKTWDEPSSLVRAIDIYMPEVWVRMASEWVPSQGAVENLAGFGGGDTAYEISEEEAESWKLKIADFAPENYARLKARAEQGAEQTRIADENFENLKREQGKLDS